MVVGQVEVGAVVEVLSYGGMSTGSVYKIIGKESGKFGKVRAYDEDGDPVLLHPRLQCEYVD